MRNLLRNPIFRSFAHSGASAATAAAQAEAAAVGGGASGGFGGGFGGFGGAGGGFDGTADPSEPPTATEIRFSSTLAAALDIAPSTEVGSGLRAFFAAAAVAVARGTRMLVYGKERESRATRERSKARGGSPQVWVPASLPGGGGVREHAAQ